MAAGVGIGFNLGAATGYLFIDATGLRRGLNTAQSSFDAFQSKVANRSAAATKAANAAVASANSAVLSSAATQARLSGLQSNVVSATANATLQIADSYEKRGKAIAELTKVSTEEQARVAAAEQNALEATKKRDALEQKIANAQRQRARTTDPAEKARLDKQIAGYTRAYNAAVLAATSANRSLAQIRNSASKNIDTATKRAVSVVTAANAAQIRSVDAVRADRLGRRHLGEAAIGASRVDAELHAGRLRLLGRAGEAAGDQLEAVVEPGGDAVHATDEGPLPAAHHADPQPPPGPSLCLRALADHEVSFLEVVEERRGK